MTSTCTKDVRILLDETVDEQPEPFLPSFRLDPSKTPPSLRSRHVRKLTRPLHGLEPHRIEKLCQAIAGGCTISSALVYANVSNFWWKRIRRLMERLKSEEFELTAEEIASNEFNALVSVAYDLILAEAKLEVKLTSLWTGHCERNWQSCQALLSRRFPKDWGNPVVSGVGGSRVNVQITNQQNQNQLSVQQSGVSREVMLELVRNLTEDQEQEMLMEYRKLQDAAGLVDKSDED